jgi:hypothetical protein
LDSKMKQVVDTIWSRFTPHGYVEKADVDQCRTVPGCYAGIVARWRISSIEERETALDEFPEIGAQFHTPRYDEELNYGPYLVEKSLIGAVVEALSDSNEGLRSKACEILALKVPDRLLHPNAASIEIALAKHPGMGHAARLAGKLPRRIAKRLLASSKEIPDAEQPELDAVFGKLGDTKRESRLIEAYDHETDSRLKTRMALLLGYAATPRCLRMLVRELRTPQYYEWNGRGKRSFRMHIIEALSLAYPEEPLLWKPYSYPSGDEYYARIEGWAMKELGAKWDRPRPPFLWEEQVPIPKPGWKRKPFPGEKPSIDTSKNRLK